MSTNEPCDLTEPINPEIPQALSQSPAEPPPLPAPPKARDPRGIPESAIPRRLVKEDCERCFGRGWTGRLVSEEEGLVVPCRCVLEATSKLIKRKAAEAARKDKK